MTTEIAGSMLGDPNERFAIVVARWNSLVTGRLLDGAIDTFRRHGIPEKNLTVVHVPGSFEIPLAARTVAETGDYAGVCCLGAVIQGETTHHEYINHAAASALMEAGQETGVPILFGILTCGSMEQALDRAGGKAGNKGHEAATAALEMANVLRELRK